MPISTPASPLPASSITATPSHGGEASPPLLRESRSKLNLQECLPNDEEGDDYSSEDVLSDSDDEGIALFDEVLGDTTGLTRRGHLALPNHYPECGLVTASATSTIFSLATTVPGACGCARAGRKKKRSRAKGSAKTKTHASHTAPSRRAAPRKRQGLHQETIIKTRKLGSVAGLLGGSLVSHAPIKTTHTEHLYPGSRFVGYQRNIQHDHRVEVDIQFADLKQSYLCGYLTIYNLTSKLPVLTTFFEAEIIGERHSFSTRKWNSNFRNDLEHWNKFPDFAEFEAVANQDRPIPNILGHPTIFMRWKEIFLAPNHRVTHIDGASFEGFYFIQYQQSTGDITGYYYHAESEKYQLLTLSHVCNNAVPYFEFS